MTLVIATFVGLLAGYYLDRWLGTAPWQMMFGAIFGFGIGAGVVKFLRR